MSADKLMVATKSFITTDEDGKRVVVHAGKSRFRASHPIAKAFWAFFKDADPAPEVEDTSSRPGTKRGRSSSTVTPPAPPAPPAPPSGD